MATLIFPVCFIAIIFNLALYSDTIINKRELLLKAVLIFCFLVVLVTEVLSSLNALNFKGILICWGVVFIAITGNLIRNRKYFGLQYNTICDDLKSELNNTSLPIKWLMGGSVLLIITIFFQGIIYPPNNWDSMTYHMARIPSWISHNSVENYPTHIIRQLYQPPFAEFFILHINLLSGSDCFSNLVQFCFMLFTLVAITGIAKKIGLNTQSQWLTALLVITMPEIILQASSTQNDLVVTFFVTATMYFAIEAVNMPKLKYYLPFGLATGLAMLTKGTAYIYLAPILIIALLCVLYKIIRKRRYAHLIYGIAAIVLIVAVNVPHWYRNYTLTGSMLGIDKDESRLYANEHMSGILLLSNMLKNGGLHIGIKGDSHVSNFSDTVIHKLHRAVHVNIDDPATNYLAIKYSTRASAAHEDSARNPFHFVFIITAFIVVAYHVLKSRQHTPAAVLILVILFQVLLFCAYLKWQPWHSRLHVTMFVLSLPVIVYAAGISTYFRKTLYLLLPVIIGYGILITVANELRPLKPAVIMEDRYQKYFIAKPAAYPEYLSVKKQIEKNEYKNIGLLIGGDDWQYPLFVDCYSQTINPVHINVNNFTVKAGKPGFVDCIVSTTINEPKITYRGKDFYNQNPQNKIIHIYK